MKMVSVALLLISLAFLAHGAFAETTITITSRGWAGLEISPDGVYTWTCDNTTTEECMHEIIFVPSE